MALVAEVKTWKERARAAEADRRRLEDALAAAEATVATSIAEVQIRADHLIERARCEAEHLTLRAPGGRTPAPRGDRAGAHGPRRHITDRRRPRLLKPNRRRTHVLAVHVRRHRRRAVKGVGHRQGLTSRAVTATEFDPIASPTTRLADHRERQFVHEDEAATTTTRLSGFRDRSAGRGPNLLVILMDDVGWGDFGCYGGGVAVGAPTPNIDRLARRGLLLTSCYSEPSCTPQPGVAAHRPPADAPRAAAAADVRRAGRPAGRGHPGPAPVRRRLRHPGRRQVAPGREPRVPAPERRASTTSTASCPCPTCTRVAGPALLPRDRLLPRPAPTGSRTCRSTGASSTPTRGGEPRTSRR